MWKYLQQFNILLQRACAPAQWKERDGERRMGIILPHRPITACIIIIIIVNSIASLLGTSPCKEILFSLGHLLNMKLCKAYSKIQGNSKKLLTDCYLSHGAPAQPDLNERLFFGRFLHRLSGIKCFQVMSMGNFGQDFWAPQHFYRTQV